jgi:hypothetical protein
MRLLEVAPDFVRSQAGILMTILQHLESRTKPGTKVPIANIQKLMMNAGYSFNNQELSSLIDSTPYLKKLVTSQDDNYITIGGEEQKPLPDGPKGDKEAAVVDKMANHALNK